MKHTSLTKYSVLAVLFVAASCTKLDENSLLYDQVTESNFYKTDKQLASAVGAAYSSIYGYNGAFFNLNEVTTDEVVVPTRGADWGDGGHWVRLKTHTTNSSDSQPANGWNLGFGGVTTCNKLLAALAVSDSPTAVTYVAELKALRAIYYYWLLDLFGNVPITTDFSETAPPATKPRAEVYAFIEKELLENVDKLPKVGTGDGPYYGRVTYYVVQATLAKLYLNAQTYTGTPQYDKALAACDIIINSGKFQLMNNYADIFSRNNIGSTESIWAIPFDGVKAKGFNMNMETLHLQSQNTYQMNNQPWNGFASVQEFYQSYIDPAQNPGPQGTVVGLDPKGTPTTGTLDKRMLNNFIVGPQFQADGVTPLTDGGADKTDPDGQPITLTPYVNELQPNAWRQAGARIGKWQFYKGMLTDLDNDLAIYRYADILLMKAELLARKNSNWSDPVALALVNQIRTIHGGVSPLPGLTAETFLAERGREMFAESYRRQDMLRFGTYNSKYRFHDADANTNVNIFPIPEPQINANPNLKQNPGY
ncbi:RagB/SusD family nutrient uptake outer membrane protein [Mucilaginibacter sp. ZT4R22]|uniref:RagB/SusD family nutrient uptake outer membrane protein n=1 Tax=Mucilaginibacter pankratovii TaxID=2772110 RepID=A0ABR7WY75_9SPHI|nr:RagB/SusD family nutrient uptake outer membrane protein [Mucilaginibacter pankratovii]MBD1367236.1 RagB/SusD family nutrient uptake outer membrane protein [Mucilaginibacter pankratovii]